jgi:hypothetical protein
MTVGWRSPVGGPRYDGPLPDERVRDERRVEGVEEPERESTASRRPESDADAATDCKHATHGRLGRTTG